MSEGKELRYNLCQTREHCLDVGLTDCGILGEELAEVIEGDLAVDDGLYAEDLLALELTDGGNMLKQVEF